jgi:hypothetical protein
VNEHLCKQAYNDVVEYTARLASYATSRLSDVIGDGHYEARANELAVRDIIILSISVRRLTELTGKYDLIRGLNVPFFTAHRVDGNLLFDDSDHVFNAWEIIGNIIHAKTLLMVKNDADFHLEFVDRKRDPYYLFNLYRQKKIIDGVCIVESDRGNIKAFQAFKFVKVIVEFTDKIDDFLSDNQIFVGSMFE